jgi:type II secretory pathway component PulM
MTARPDYLRKHSTEQQSINLAGLRGLMAALQQVARDVEPEEEAPRSKRASPEAELYR